ncbi:hypothetical protein KR044_007326 [Drosophila immigrans]|nr:hypothetical protein KR044_007326 [Drosophila immigrans]
MKLSIESVQTNCDHNFVEYFHKVPESEMLYTFRVVKLAPTFTITVTIRALKSQRIMYQINKLDGCQFLNNPILSKPLARTYHAIVANNTIFRCPIPPKVYFLRNMLKAKLLIRLHPPGRFQVSVNIQTSLSSAPFVMEVIWKYSVAYIK